MPYRIDARHAGADTFDRLVALGALDADATGDGNVAAILPDSVSPEQVRHALGKANLRISPAEGRDAGSVWVLRQPTIPVGDGTLRLIDAPAFGTGLHPTTRLCLDALQDIVGRTRVETMLDVGTGSGVLALAALMLGVPRVDAIDVDEAALETAAANARLNGFDARLRLILGGPETVAGAWPLVVANILAAPLIDMAPVLVQRIGHGGELVLSGIPESAAADVERTYRDLGLWRTALSSRSGWVALMFRASW